MKLVLQITAGVIIGTTIVNVAEYYIGKYQIEIALRNLNQIFNQKKTGAKKFDPTNYETEILTIAPEGKETCLIRSNGIYDKKYLNCRQGQIITLKKNLKTEEVKVIRKEPIIKDVNIL